MTNTLILAAACLVILPVLGWLIWRLGNHQIDQANLNVFGTTDPPDTSAAGTSHVTVLAEFDAHAKREAAKRHPSGGGAA